MVNWKRISEKELEMVGAGYHIVMDFNIGIIGLAMDLMWSIRERKSSSMPPMFWSKELVWMECPFTEVGKTKLIHFYDTQAV